MRVLLFFLGCAGLVGVLVSTTHELSAQTPAPNRSTPRRSATEARWRAEDAALAAITEGEVADRLRAIQRTPELEVAPLALPTLSPIAAGDDPILAPAAASAAWRIARALDLDTLRAEEVDLGPVHDARAGYLALANDESARADLRQLASFVADALAQLDAPAVLPTAE
ncbi:MAG: hypothetical protein MUE69_00280 [Myxococcota bacterium]|jgi:hypothetical protein|nr:hypothetical protein [Myxococcota bacterium]